MESPTEVNSIAKLWFMAWDPVLRALLPAPKLKIDDRRLNLEEAEELRSPDNLDMDIIYRARVMMRMAKGYTMVDMEPLYKGALYKEALKPQIKPIPFVCTETKK